MPDQMTFAEYQKRAAEAAVYPEIWLRTGLDPTAATFLYPAIGLCNKAADLAEKLREVARERGGAPSAEDLVGIRRELGETLRYLAALAAELGLSLDEIAKESLEELASRKVRGWLHGEG